MCAVDDNDLNYANRIDEGCAAGNCVDFVPNKHYFLSCFCYYSILDNCSFFTITPNNCCWHLFMHICDGCIVLHEGLEIAQIRRVAHYPLPVKEDNKLIEWQWQIPWPTPRGCSILGSSAKCQLQQSTPKFCCQRGFEGPSGYSSRRLLPIKLDQ